MAKGQSLRLPGKNLCEIGGRSLVELALDYVKRSKYVDDIVVATESAAVQEIAQGQGVKVFLEDQSMLELPLREVARAVVSGGNWDICCILQPDNPVRAFPLDTYIERLNMGFSDVITGAYDDNRDLVRGGAVRVCTRAALLGGHLSDYQCILVQETGIDIHTAEDLERARAVARAR